jgi:hypothetical protein
MWLNIVYMKKILTKSEFIKKAKNTHGDTYVYDFAEYIRSNIKVKILCHIHGMFEQTPSNHLSGKGCRECSIQNRVRKMTTEEFIKKANHIHNNKYDYSSTIYNGCYSKVSIMCGQHGTFTQISSQHLSGKGCQLCGRENTINASKSSKIEFIQKANIVHKNEYDYALIDYKSSNTKVKIICNKHGSFSQTPSNHLRGNGCPSCGLKKRGIKRRLTEEQFVKKSIEIHQDVYNYSFVEYKTSHVKVKIICKKHGDFYQTPDNHLHGNGCPMCACAGTSKQEKDILNFVKQHYKGIIIENDRNILKPKELDIVLPELKIAIEYCGLYWHSNEFMGKNYHLDKLEKCNKVGYRLITIFEDEWIHKRDIVESKILNILSVSETTNIFARKTKIVNISIKDRNQFLNTHHIQGEAAGSVNIGLEYDGKLVSVMSFKKRSRGVYELIRFASSCNVVGGFSKLLIYFKINYEWTGIVSFADLRWSSQEKNVYLSNGFELDSVLKPEYRYIIGKERKHKFGFRHKHLKKMLDNYDQILSEATNTLNNGIYRIYDCGLARFVMKRY